MTIELPALPYAMDALEPALSAKTLEFHYGRHHRGYFEKLQGLVAGTRDENAELEQIVTNASGALFNNAAQVWNHSFYWDSMTPGGGGQPRGRIGEAIHRDFGSFGAFREQFKLRATGLFGSGYLWLTLDPENGQLALEAMKDADNPMLHERVPLIGMDVWEHAYYLDYQNERDRYVEAFLTELANWRFADANLEKAGS